MVSLKTAKQFAFVFLVGAALGSRHAAVSADSCEALSGFGHCALELDGCDPGSCSYEPGDDGGGTLSGSNCTGGESQCDSEEWQLDYSEGGNYWVRVTHLLVD